MRYESIVQTDTSCCLLCGRTDCLEWHHVFNASNKKNSEKYKLMVRLCHWCHNEPPGGVHHNKEVRNHLCALSQKAFTEKYPQLNFLSIFGKNYL